MAIDKKPGRGSDQFPLRLPDGMRDTLKAAAEVNGRSMNAEIITRLEQSLTLVKLIDDYRQAEEKLFEQARTERELRKQIKLLEEQVDMLKNGEMEVDLTSAAVQDAMVKRLQEVMGNVVEDMREEHRIANGMPLLLRWFDQNPEGRAEYDSLSDDEQDEYVREKTHELWIEHLNQKRAGRTARKPTVKIPTAAPTGRHKPVRGVKPPKGQP